MSQDSDTGGRERPRSITLERLAELLDAYGGAPERWPDAERAAAQRLVDESVGARTLWEKALHLDRVIDALPSQPPSSSLHAQVLAAMPHRRVARLWPRRVMIAVPAAAAAALMLWLAIGRQPARQVNVAALRIGEYTSPTDVLLEPFAIDMSSTVPSVGCSDSILGCPNIDAADGLDAPRRVTGRSDG